MKIGVTGSRDGPTAEQKRNFRQWITDNPCEELHHGCCAGVDAFAAFIGAGRTKRCVGHPPTNDALIDQHAVDLSDKIREPADYLVRDQHIVDETDVLCAMPKYDENDSRAARSGTWATVRMARQVGKPIFLFMADGRVIKEPTTKREFRCQQTPAR